MGAMLYLQRNSECPYLPADGPSSFIRALRPSWAFMLFNSLLKDGTGDIQTVLRLVSLLQQKVAFPLSSCTYRSFTMCPGP